MAAVPTAFLVTAMAAILSSGALGGTITVGAPGGGWDQTTDLQTWAASQTFTAGDTIVFQYAPSHDVLEVSKADYDACRASNPVKSYGGGGTSIRLPAAGKRYFICGTAGHCAGGMKLEVDVGAATAAAPSPGSTPATEAPKSSVESPSAEPQGVPPPDSSTVVSPAPAVSSPAAAAPSAATGTPASAAAAAVLGSGLLLAVLRAF